MALERKYTAETKAEALALVDELRSREPEGRSAVRRAAETLGVGEQSLRSWLKARERRMARTSTSSGPSNNGGAHSAVDPATEEMLLELTHLRGECARLRAAINALITP